jgi:hypothetical protein
LGLDGAIGACAITRLGDAGSVAGLEVEAVLAAGAGVHAVVTNDGDSVTFFTVVTADRRLGEFIIDDGDFRNAFLVSGRLGPGSRNGEKGDEDDL